MDLPIRSDCYGMVDRFKLFIFSKLYVFPDASRGRLIRQKNVLTLDMHCGIMSVVCRDGEAGLPIREDAGKALEVDGEESTARVLPPRHLKQRWWKSPYREKRLAVPLLSLT